MNDDGRVAAGIVIAKMCSVVATILIFTQQLKLCVLHWAFVSVALAGVGTISVTKAQLDTPSHTHKDAKMG